VELSDKRNFHFLLAPLILASLFACTTSTYAQAEKESNAKEAMRLKVACSMQVLVGITLEDYGLIADNAEKLVELSNKTNWYSRQVPEYELFLNEFRRNAQELKKAGQEKNHIECLCSDDIELRKLS
jgi:hypothetical protein